MKRQIALIAAFLIGVGVGAAGTPEGVPTEREAGVRTDVRSVRTLFYERPRVSYVDVAVAAEDYRISDRLAYLILREAENQNVPADLALNLVERESSFIPAAVSTVGAAGLTQIRPMTARIYEPDVTRERLLQDTTTALRLGFRYLADLRARFGSWSAALHAYVDGPTDYASGSRAGSAYAEDVLKR